MWLGRSRGPAEREKGVSDRPSVVGHGTCSWYRPKPRAGFAHASRFVWDSLSDPFNLLLLAFVAPILLMISFIAGAGGFEGIVRVLARYSKGPRSTQIMTAVAGRAIFFDEYAHIMIIG